MGPQDLGTLEVMEKWPVTLVLALYAKKQLGIFRQEGKRPAYPILYTFLTGKFFMIFRLVMSYSSGKLGPAINYFVWQELILISTHMIFSAAILPCLDDDPDRIQDLKKTFCSITVMDILKTLFTFVYWLNFQPGLMATTCDRLPTIESQIYASLLIHGVLDVVQSATTVFTMYISRFVKNLTMNVDATVEGDEPL